MIRNRFIVKVKEFEGLKLDLYKDTVGKLTIGWGRNLSDNGISLGEAEMLVENDAESAQADARKLKEYWKLSGDAQEILMHMIFQMGLPGVMKFKKMLAAMDGTEVDYLTAAKEMRNSLWHKQTPRRAEAMASWMERCSKEA